MAHCKKEERPVELVELVGQLGPEPGSYPGTNKVDLEYRSQFNVY